MNTFNKTCKRCQNPYQGARNARFCPDCTWQYTPKGERTSKFRLNHNVLGDREVLSYILGFGCTDGSVAEDGSTVKNVRLLSTDKELIELITFRLEYERPVSLNRTFDDHRKDCWENIFYSDHARFLVSKGLRKDKEQLTLEDMDVDIYPFLRGHCDGDGTISPAGRTVSFLGRKLMMDSISDRLNRDGFPVSEARPTQGKLWTVQVGGNPRVADLLHRMYEGSTLHLQRKYEQATVFWERVGLW